VSAPSGRRDDEVSIDDGVAIVLAAIHGDHPAALRFFCARRESMFNPSITAEKAIAA
jgi:hypothetical protein